MRCYICNDLLDPHELQLDKNKTWEPCTKCKTASYEWYEKDEPYLLIIDNEERENEG
jgi:hypothetical protein